jgi:branched-chain amino acid transport system permease protein
MALLPCGVHFETYERDMAYIHTRAQWVCLVLFLVMLMLLPQINLGQSAFMGMGAFVCGSLAVNFNLPFWITIPAGGLGGAILGAIFGIPALRIKGFYLAMTTIAAQVIFPLIIMHMPDGWFGGAIGLNIEPAKLGGITFNSDTSLYYLIIITTLIMIFLAFNLVRGRTGRAFVAIRDNDIAAEIMGVNLFFYKTLAFAIGAMYAGVAGGLWAYYLRFVGADQFTLYFSVWYMGMLIVGGLGNILGAILGVIFIRSLLEIITYLAPLLVEYFPGVGHGIWFAGMNILLGGAIIVFLIYEPRGLYHRWRIGKAAFRIWPFPHM